MSIFRELSWRGLVHQTTSDELAGLLEREKISLYAGFDPSATSLHAGSLMPLLTLQRFRREGHRPIVLLGGATGLIGDPSGKSAERTLEPAEVVRARGDAMGRQMRTFFERLDGPEPLFVNNLDWLGEARLLEFLRDIGKHFSVNAMMGKDSVRRRFEVEETGISFTEFSYALLQAADFRELYRRHQCRLQLGASDQWGNIVSGIDLIRRLEGGSAFGLTTPLLTNAEGKKYGKTESGAVWLDPELTSPYRFYQFWINTQDADVGRFLRWFTFRPEPELRALEATVGAPERTAQRALAWDVTALVHGEEAAARSKAAAEALFGGELHSLPVATLLQMAGDVPSVTVTPADLTDAGMPVTDLLVRAGACSSKSDARRQIQQGGVRMNGEALTVAAVDRKITPSDFREGKVLLVQRGKRNNYLVLLDGGK
jgi:tyrosyl-tRNA synthetase